MNYLTIIKNVFYKKFIILFSAEKCIKNLFLNILGFQVYRYILAKIFYFLKTSKAISEEISDLKEYGYQIHPNFFSREEFEKIKKEYFQLIKDTKFSKRVEQGSGKIDDGINYINANIDDDLKNEYPAIFGIKENETIKKYFNLAEKKNDTQLYCRLESIEIVDPSIPDPQKSYHYDTFHNTFKAWIFIEEVKDSDGPFRYVPFSHVFSLRRVWTEWKSSIVYCVANISSSFRHGNNYKNLLDDQSFKCSVSENVFVMANTHGLHRRGDGKMGATRHAIQLWTRENPFKIFI
jgi:hypothetical protein